MARRLTRSFLLLTTFVVATVVVPLVGQQLDQKALTFEVASVKPNTSGDRGVGLNLTAGGRFNGTNVPVRTLIAAAYGTPQPLPDFRIVGGPAWIDSDRFDILAKAVVNGQGGAPPELFAMLQALLAERFKLSIHHEPRDLPIYALIRSHKDQELGPRLRKSDVDCNAQVRAAAGSPSRSGERPVCSMRGGVASITGGAVPIGLLAAALSVRLNRVVVDRTGRTERFDLDLNWTPEQLPRLPAGAPTDQPFRLNGEAIDPNGPSLFTALQEQLGLKLESTTGPVDVIVIDHVERPTPD